VHSLDVFHITDIVGRHTEDKQWASKKDYNDDVQQKKTEKEMFGCTTQKTLKDGRRAIYELCIKLSEYN